MPIGSYLQAWRMSRGQSIAALAAKTGLEARSLEEIRAGQVDAMLVEMMKTVASALGVPPSWLHGDPKQIDLLTSDADGDESDAPSVQSLDPVVEHIVQAAQQDRELYVLLTRGPVFRRPQIDSSCRSQPQKFSKTSQTSYRPMAKPTAGTFRTPERLRFFLSDFPCPICR